MAEDFLGISAHVDFGDFEKFIQHICEGLERLGMDTAEISQKLNNAFEKPDTSALEKSLASLKEELSTLTEGTKENEDTLPHSHNEYP